MGLVGDEKLKIKNAKLKITHVVVFVCEKANQLFSI